MSKQEWEYIGKSSQWLDKKSGVDGSGSIMDSPEGTDESMETIEMFRKNLKHIKEYADKVLQECKQGNHPEAWMIDTVSKIGEDISDVRHALEEYDDNIEVDKDKDMNVRVSQN